MYRLKIKPSARKELKKLPQNDYCRILAAFDLIAKDPFLGKKLEGEHKGRRSFRVWPYRIIYAILEEELLVLVISVGHRQGVY
jgi:mRNA interferase RelE/StbE